MGPDSVLPAGLKKASAADAKHTVVEDFLLFLGRSHIGLERAQEPVVWRIGDLDLGRFGAEIRHRLGDRVHVPPGLHRGGHEQPGGLAALRPGEFGLHGNDRLATPEAETGPRAAKRVSPRLRPDRTGESPQRANRYHP